MTNNIPIHRGSHLKKIFKNSSMYFLSSILSKASSLVLLPILTKVLALHEYGILANLLSVVSLMSIMVSLYMDSALARFYFDHNKSHVALKNLVSTVFMFELLWGGMVTVAFVAFSRYYLSSKYGVAFFPTLVVVSCLPIFIQLGLLGKVYLKNNLKTNYVAIPDVVIFIFTTSISIYFIYYCKLGINGRLYGLLIGVLVTFLYYSYFLVSNRLLSIKINKALLFDSLKYSIPLIPVVFASWITISSDRLLITYFKNVSQSGLYDVAYNISKGIRIFTESIFQVYAPIVTSMYVHSKMEFNVRMSRFATQFTVLMLVAGFYFTIYASDIVFYFTSKPFYEAYKLIPIIIFGYCFSSHAKYLNMVFTLRKMTYLLSAGYLIQAGINFVLNIIFIPYYGMQAAAWTTSISLLFLTLWSGYWFLKYEQVKFEWRKLLEIHLIIVFMLVYYFVIEKYISLARVPMLFIKFVITTPLLMFLIVYKKLINPKKIIKAFTS